MNTKDTLICIVLIALALYACASVAAVGGELRAAAVQQELSAELEEQTADNTALREKLEAGLSDAELERLARERLVLSSREIKYSILQQTEGVNMELTVGEVLEGKSRVSPNSARVCRARRGRSGLVHISEVANTFVSDVNEYLKVARP